MRKGKRSVDGILGALDECRKSMTALAPLAADRLAAERTALVVIDMVNGFAREGALASPQVTALIPHVTALVRRCGELGIARIALSDCHTSHSAEFASFPSHCQEGTEEAELVGELQEVGGLLHISKNSTNGFLEEEFLRWLGTHPDVDTFLVAGDCTDICIQQFALTLKAHFNRLDLTSRVIVPADAVATYDAPGHNAALCHLMALCNMRTGGVEIVSGVR